MKNRIALPLLALALLASPLRADPGAIRGVIGDQLAAFQRDDLDAAFAHASPGIQALFGDAQNFGRMVQAGYPMVWRPEVVEMRALTQTPRGPVQTVLFQGADGRLAEADYLMELVDGRWRIAGVTLRVLPGLGS